VGNEQKRGKEEVVNRDEEVNREEQDDLKVKKAWEIAIGPAKKSASPPVSLFSFLLGVAQVDLFAIVSR
jgi:hypothetical protein